MSAVKRMHRDIRDYLRSKSLNEQGIFCIFDEEDIFRVRAMIVGPDDTPYYGGYYFFDMQFPTEYPHKPPKVSYETRWQDIRFHPNLYANSKVCLSILGTWSGPGWTSAQTLSSVLLTIQSLLMKDPLTNEPGYEVRKPYTEKKHKLYESLITFENFRTAILRMLEAPPLGFEAFLPIMQKCFVVNARRIHKYMSDNAQNEKCVSTVRCGVYNFKRIIDYTECMCLMEQTMHSCGIEQPEHSNATDTQETLHSCITEPTQEKSITSTETDKTLNTSMQTLSVFETPNTLESQTPYVGNTVNTKTNKIKRPSVSAKFYQGQMQVILQPNGKQFTFESRKCKQLDHTKPPKWQWRKL